jgi:hypothetical protein
MLLLDGVYTGGHAQQRFQRVKAPDRAELEHLVYAISARTGHYLERQGRLVRDPDNSYLTLEPADNTGLEGVLGSSVTCRTDRWSSDRLPRRAFSHSCWCYR